MPSFEGINAVKRGHMRTGAILICKNIIKAYFKWASMPSKDNIHALKRVPLMSWAILTLKTYYKKHISLGHLCPQKRPLNVRGHSDI